MLKQALLGTAILIATPALAQVQTAPAAPAQAEAPVADVTATAPVADPAASATPADPAATAPAETAATVPAEQVASVVDQQFATYDKDADGKLDEAEFAGWMVALKSQTDPKTDANAPAIRQWNKAAFAQADTDKSRSLTKAELTGFLTPAKS